MENSNQDPSVAASNNNSVGEQAQNTSSAPEAAPPIASIELNQQESTPPAVQPSVTEVPAEKTQSAEQEPQTPPAPVLETSSLSTDPAVSQQPEKAGSAMLQGNIPTKSSNLKIILIALGVIILVAGGYFVYQYLTNK